MNGELCCYRINPLLRRDKRSSTKRSYGRKCHRPRSDISRAPNISSLHSIRPEHRIIRTRQDDGFGPDSQHPFSYECVHRSPRPPPCFPCWMWCRGFLPRTSTNQGSSVPTRRHHPSLLLGRWSLSAIAMRYSADSLSRPTEAYSYNPVTTQHTFAIPYITLEFDPSQTLEDWF